MIMKFMHKYYVNVDKIRILNNFQIFRKWTGVGIIF